MAVYIFHLGRVDRDWGPHGKQRELQTAVLILFLSNHFKLGTYMQYASTAAYCDLEVCN